MSIRSFSDATPCIEMDKTSWTYSIVLYFVRDFSAS